VRRSAKVPRVLTVQQATHKIDYLARNYPGHAGTLGMLQKLIEHQAEELALLRADQGIANAKEQP
jgi:hypothetical protein